MIKVGDRVKGFKYDENTPPHYFAPNMDKYIGKVGSVLYVKSYYFAINFGEIYYTYPLNHPLAKSISKLKQKLK